MAGMKSRVLRAYFANDGLVMYETRLLFFDGVRNAESPAHFCLDYMASEVVGDTAVTGTPSAL
jgi:hypothetical protein